MESSATSTERCRGDKLHSLNRYVQQTILRAFSTAVKSYFQTVAFLNCMNTVVERLVAFTAAEEEAPC